jgi:hypothetical protein
VYLVEIKTPSDDDGYAIFETMAIARRGSSVGQRLLCMPTKRRDQSAAQLYGSRP